MSDHEAGRALDALIAEKIMGWRAWRERRGEYALCVAVPGGVREPWLSARHPEPERYTAVSCADALRIGFYGTEFPAYSTNIAAAWLVVGRVQTLHPGWRFSLLGGDVSFGYGWRAAFFGDADPMKDYGQRHADEWGGTPAVAICVAAIAALPSCDPEAV